MIQSRNLAVFALACLLLGFFGIGRLFLFETAGSTPMMIGSVIVADTESNVSSAVALADDIDREANLRAMRAALEAADVRIMSGQSGSGINDAMLSDRLALANDNAPTEEESAESQAIEITWCDATVLESQFVAAWPSSGVSVRETEGARMVVVERPSLTATGTPTIETIMQFPRAPRQQAEPACLTHAYIGVTPDGRLIHNNDVILYAGYGPTELVGFAFDGHPIYGGVEAETDQCGGVETGGYSYHVDPDREFILGCFISEPQPTLLAS